MWNFGDGKGLRRGVRGRIGTGSRAVCGGDSGGPVWAYNSSGTFDRPGGMLMGTHHSGVHMSGHIQSTGRIGAGLQLFLDTRQVLSSPHRANRLHSI